MRTNPYYSIYYINLCRLIILGVIPLALLTFFNCAIYNRMKVRSKIIEENLSKRMRINQENDLAKVLMAIVALFIFCHTLRFFLNFYEMVFVKSAMSCFQAGQREFPIWSVIVYEFSRLLLILNSSINIVIYCCLNKKFRRQVLRYRKTIHSKFSTRNRNTINDNHGNDLNCRIELQPLKQNLPA